MSVLEQLNERARSIDTHISMLRGKRIGDKSPVPDAELEAWKKTLIEWDEFFDEWNTELFGPSAAWTEPWASRFNDWNKKLQFWQAESAVFPTAPSVAAIVYRELPVAAAQTRGNIGLYEAQKKQAEESKSQLNKMLWTGAILAGLFGVGYTLSSVARISGR